MAKIIGLSYTVSYDLDDPRVIKDYLEYMDMHPLSEDSLQEFLLDRFINPEEVDPKAELLYNGKKVVL